MNDGKQVIVSGVKPTGRGQTHIGNYFGMMKQLVDMQNEYFIHAFIPDYHALTTLHEADTLKKNILDIAIDYIAVGLDTNKVHLFKQSDVPEHTELAWIFNCITPISHLERAHAYKAAQADKKEVSVGTFEYPLLMAADILLYDADIVPVGSDQKQHVEITRDVAQRFNNTFGETFKLPAEKIVETVAIVPGTDGRKMSKSYGNIVPLFAEDIELEKAVMSIVTDSKTPKEPKDPETCNIFALHKLFSTEELPTIEKRYREGEIGYKESKEILLENLKSFIQPLRERRKTLAADQDRVLDILKRGGEIAREQATEKMREIREKVGVALY